MDAAEPVLPVWLRERRAGVGRPAERSRAEVTAAAVALADGEGLAAVTMRRVAARLGTGAASLYRYVTGRDDLLDLMADEAAAGYDLPAPDGPWVTGLLEVARQGRAIMLRHPWLPELVLTRPTLGPHGVDLLEHVLTLLAGHPAAAARKMEAFAVLNTVTAAFALNELGATAGTRQRQGAYLAHAVAAGGHPQVAAVLGGAFPATAAPAERFEETLSRILAGLLAPDD
ncbi:TetR/AcrR family transcriptional regulator C-terminal domain-containing protein [Plantactinospora sp. S1510]|uniref:TetR/AcrR family transcriptional regulator C-terminal domain-containing protein n=1 Tax=Plantactinospora alkalitolerans TaxID=2789879 RepID=A0ABS0H4B0_9ACTN|nr:TetR/AcrR family transcriptional regulator [Plantactinospora alkalitolerans]MBF9133300.1 TetR/AcrR family transcriptional regulator C-terminal domain-containing protein [Plantactinospora alkalitolerans]